MYWFYFPVNSGFLCAKDKVTDLNAHSFLHTAHSNVIVILGYLLCGYTGFRKHINPNFVH